LRSTALTPGAAMNYTYTVSNAKRYRAGLATL
jgi:hypothetical protein